MNHNKQAGRLILENLDLFNETAILYETIESDIYAKLCELIQIWTNSRDWTVDFLDGLGGSKLYSPVFRDENFPDRSNAWFEILVIQDTSDYFLADLCGVGTTTVGFWFGADAKALGFENKRAWNKRLQSVADRYGDRLSQFGIKLDDRFYLPFTLDQKKLADAWADDIYDELFQPIKTALGTLENAVPIFDEMLREMRSIPG